MAFAELSPSEQQIVLQCMKAIADGPEIENWDFHTRLGIVRPSLIARMGQMSLRAGPS
jgi:hypothetical protein